VDCLSTIYVMLIEYRWHRGRES